MFSITFRQHDNRKFEYGLNLLYAWMFVIYFNIHFPVPRVFVDETTCYLYARLQLSYTSYDTV